MDRHDIWFSFRMTSNLFSSTKLNLRPKVLFSHRHRWCHAYTLYCTCSSLSLSDHCLIDSSVTLLLFYLYFYLLRQDIFLLSVCHMLYLKIDTEKSRLTVSSLLTRMNFTINRKWECKIRQAVAYSPISFR